MVCYIVHARAHPNTILAATATAAKPKLTPAPIANADPICVPIPSRAEFASSAKNSVVGRGAPTAVVLFVRVFHQYTRCVSSSTTGRQGLASDDDDDDDDATSLESRRATSLPAPDANARASAKRGARRARRRRGGDIARETTRSDATGERRGANYVGALTMTNY